MKWFFKPCGRYRQSICLLAGGALPEEQKQKTTNHLADCADCRGYFDDLKTVTVPLATWEKSLLHIQPDSSLQFQWEQAVRVAAKTKSIGSAPRVQTFWREFVLPARWHLAAIGALWMIATFLNIEPSFPPAAMAQNKASPRDLLMALRENRRQVAELINSPITEPAALPEVFVPRPRSEIPLPIAVA